MSSGTPTASDSEFEITMNKNICYQGTDHESDACSSSGSSHSDQETSSSGDSTAAACKTQHTNSKVLVALKTSGITFPTTPASSKSMSIIMYNMLYNDKVDE